MNLDFGSDENGNLVKKTKTYAIISEALKVLKQHEAERINGTITMPTDTTLNEWLSYWLNNVIELNRECTTVYAYKQMIDNHIAPNPGTLSYKN